MKDKESNLPQDWFNIADKDLKRVEIMLNADDTVDAGVHLQQAIEKYLKGYLLSRGWKLERTHNLIKLLDYAVEYEPSFEDFRELCQKTTTYYIIERYPFFQTEDIAEEEEIQERLKKTIEFKDKILDYYSGQKND